MDVAFLVILAEKLSIEAVNLARNDRTDGAHLAVFTYFLREPQFQFMNESKSHRWALGY